MNVNTTPKPDYTLRLVKVANDAWELWMGHGAEDAGAHDQASRRAAQAAAAISYSHLITDAVWTHATLARLCGLPVGTRLAGKAATPTVAWSPIRAIVLRSARTSGFVYGCATTTVAIIGPTSPC